MPVSWQAFCHRAIQSVHCPIIVIRMERKIHTTFQCRMDSSPSLIFGLALCRHGLGMTVKDLSLVSKKQDNHKIVSLREDILTLYRFSQGAGGQDQEDQGIRQEQKHVKHHHPIIAVG